MILWLTFYIQWKWQYDVYPVDCPDSTTINGVLFQGGSEIITVTMSGQVKIWDLRQNTQKPTKTLNL